MIRTFSAASALALALAAVGLATTGAHAQSETPAAAPAAPTAQAQFGERHLELARDVVISSGMARSFQAVIPQMQEGLLRQIGRNPARLDDAVAVMEELQPEMELQRRAMIGRAARVIAARLSEEELADIAAFFATPAGESYVEMQPMVLEGLISEMQVWQQELSEYLQVRLQAEMAARLEARSGEDGAQTPQ